MLLPEDRSESLEIPAFCVKIVGSKAVWSTDSTMQSMFIGMLKSLSYMPVLCGLEIKHEIMKIYTMKRNLKYCCVAPLWLFKFDSLLLNLELEQLIKSRCVERPSKYKYKSQVCIQIKDNKSLSFTAA